MRIFDYVNKQRKNGKELPVRYLSTIIKSTTLGECQKESKRLSHLDDFASNLLSSSNDTMNNDSNTKSNVAREKLEYESGHMYFNIKSESCSMYLLCNFESSAVLYCKRSCIQVPHKNISY